MILNPRHNRTLLRQEDVPKNHEKHPMLLPNQNKTLEAFNKLNPVLYLFYGLGISHADSFPHWSNLFNMHVDLLANSTLYIHFTFLPPPSFHRFRAEARPARVFQYRYRSNPNA
jgi:hypothetical protein